MVQALRKKGAVPMDAVRWVNKLRAKKKVPAVNKATVPPPLAFEGKGGAVPPLF